MSFSEEVKKAEKYLDDNIEKFKEIGDGGLTVYNTLKDIFNTPEVTSLKTGYQDVDEILADAAKVDAILKQKTNLDIAKLMDTVMVGVKTALVAASLF